MLTYNLASSCGHLPQHRYRKMVAQTEMVASTGEVHHTIAKKLSLAGHQREVVRPDQV